MERSKDESADDHVDRRALLKRAGLVAAGAAVAAPVLGGEHPDAATGDPVLAGDTTIASSTTVLKADDVITAQWVMIRLYAIGGSKHVERCLYLQRVHANMTQVQQRINDAIQLGTVQNYRVHIESLAQTWAKRHGLRCLRLRTPVWLGDELEDGWEEQIVDPDDPLIDAKDGSVGLIKADGVLNTVDSR
jgi:hypothetical protein